MSFAWLVGIASYVVLSIPCGAWVVYRAGGPHCPGDVVDRLIEAAFTVFWVVFLLPAIVSPSHQRRWRRGGR